MQLTSAKNPRLQTIRRAAALGRPTEQGLVVIEGPHLIQEALDSFWEIDEIFISSEARERYVALLGSVKARITELSRRAIVSTASTQNSQEVLALVRPRKWHWDDVLAAKPRLLALDGVQDPGNAGTMVRSAEAFAASGVVFLNGTVRSSNGKFLRASAGSIFRVPFLEDVTAVEFANACRLRDIPIFALMPDRKTPASNLIPSETYALVVGNEGMGVSDELLATARPVTIPTHKIESLNAAVACSIALYAMQKDRP